jgi:hypothetical protein
MTNDEVVGLVVRVATGELAKIAAIADFPRAGTAPRD